MKGVSFPAAVNRIVSPALVPHGFKKVLSNASLIEFSRTLRGHENAVRFRSESFVPGVKLASFSLKAPKELSYADCGMLPGCPMVWRYSSAEELDTSLQHMVAILLDAGLAWLDAYTPGNVPEWINLVTRLITPVMQRMGFSPLDMHGLQDITGYVFPGLPDAMVLIDLRRPGSVLVRLHRRTAPDVSVDTRTSPVFTYSSNGDLESAIQAAQVYLLNEAPEWFGLHGL